MNLQQQAFIKAYGKCMAVAPDYELEYFFENKEKAQEGDFKQQQFVRDGAMYWGHIEDAWLLWLEAIEYARPKQEQLHALKMALFLAQYFVEEHYGDFTDSGQAQIDNERVILAREILKELEAKL
jgi:hypothetical protein